MGPLTEGPDAPFWGPVPHGGRSNEPARVLFVAQEVARIREMDLRGDNPVHQRECQGPFRLAVPLVLASASPRRRALLRALGLDFEVVPSGVEEPDPLPGEQPARYVRRVCAMKCRGVARRHPEAVTLAADTAVVLGREILGKPRDRADAVGMLRRLSGRTHQVYTAVTMLWPSRGIREDLLRKTGVFIGSHPLKVIEAYVATGEPMDKAGAYAVQGMGAFMVERIEGSYTNVVGLPVDDVVAGLLRMGAMDIR